MLQNLTIKNYALIEELSVDFERGLNIITGETGAGKSIIIDAMGLILGERADAEMIRKGSDKAVVEGIFDVTDNKKLKKILEDNEIEFENHLIIRRDISAKGQSRAYINDSPIPLTVLKDVGNLLVDLHGQHEHQSLLQTDTHIDLLDDFGGLEALKEEYHESYKKTIATVNAIKDLESREQQLIEKRSFYEFQIREIDTVNPQVNEEEELERELRILENAEKIFSSTERLYQMLYEGDNSIHDQLIVTRNELERLSEIDPQFNEIRSEAASASAIIDEIAKFIQQYNSKIDFNPDRLEEIRDRLGNISILKKKYGGSLDAVLSYRDKIGKEVALAENFKDEINTLKDKFELQRKHTSEVAQRLSIKRNEVGNKISNLIVKSLSELGMPNSVFEVKLSQRELQDSKWAIVKIGKNYFESTPRGIDFVEFYISTNVGEDPKPISKVASGGEISRIMLAMKTVLAKSDKLPILVFDEIDVGISGKIAQIVGQNLNKLSKFHQIIAITHLPQIAGFADSHYKVEKIDDGKRARTVIHKLNYDERVHEVATLLSGEDITDSGLRSAKELIENKKSKK